MFALRRHVSQAVPCQTRSLSIVENLKKILSRSAPPSPLPSEPKRAGTTAAETSAANSTLPGEKVGSSRKTKIIGSKLNVPVRLYGSELQTGLRDAFQNVLGAEKKDLVDHDKLRLVQEILQRTGRRVPDFVLNSARTSSELENYFIAEDRSAAKGINTLHLEQDKLPSNVKVL